MRKLVLSVIALLALFSVIRAFPQPAAETVARPPVQGVKVHPGLVEIGDGSSGAVLDFGLLARTGGREGTLWNLLPLRLSLRSGDTTVTLALNGMSFLVRGGVRVGRPVMVSAPVRGDIISVGGKVTVDSLVEGDVWTLGADVVLTSRAEVTGNVAALGGVVSRGPKSRVGGTVAGFPRVKIPLLGALASQASVPLLALGREVLVFVLLAFLLFLLSFYGQKRMQDLVQSAFKGWRQVLITIAVLLVAVPALVLLLVLSVAGIYLLPVLALLLAAAALAGFLAVCASFGAAVRAGDGSSALFLFTSGLLGLFLVKVPALAGILLGLLRSQTAGTIGEIARSVSLGASAAGMTWGVGAVLASTRKNSAA